MRPWKFAGCRRAFLPSIEWQVHHRANGFQSGGNAITTTRRNLSRRTLLAGAVGVAAAPAIARAQGQTAAPAPAAQVGTPASTITSPPRDWTRGHPSIYPDPDVIVADPAFRALLPGNVPLQRLWTGAQWAEGPAWSSQGQYLVFSDVTGNI